MSQKADYSIFKNLSVAFLILLAHIILIGLIGVLTMFFGWIGNNIGWVMIGVLCVSMAVAYWFYRRVKSDSRVIKDIIGDASLNGKSVEVSFLGGMASFKIGDSQSDNLKQIEAPKSDTIVSLTELSKMYEKKLITSDEFNKAKEKILKP
jgi:hypothetical protein